MKRGTPDHPKTRALIAELRIPMYSAVGLLELLWHFTAEYAPQGDIGRFSDEAIAQALGWHGSATRLVGALYKVGYLDPDPGYRWVIHDWQTHADQAVSRKIERKGLKFVVASQKLDTASQKLAITRLPEPEPEPEPEPVCIPPAIAAGERESLILEALQPDPYAIARDAIYEFWPKDKRCGTKREWLSAIVRLIPRNGKSGGRLQQLVVICRDYVAASGDLCYGFPRYCKESADAPVVPFHQSNGNGKPDHGVKPKLDFHVADPRPANAEEFKFEIKRGRNEPSR